MNLNIIHTLLLLLTVLWVSNTQTTTLATDGEKIIKLLFSEVSVNEIIGEKKGSNVISYDKFVAKIKENPLSIFQIKDLYISGWPSLIPKVQPTPVPPAAPQPQSNSTDQLRAESVNSSKTASTEAEPTSTVAQPNALQNFSGNSRIIISSNNTKGLQTTDTSDSFDTAPASTSTSKTIAPVSSASLPTYLGQPSLDSLIDAKRFYMIGLINRFRAKNNAGTVVINSLLSQIAQRHSNDMVARNYFAHESPDGTKVGDRAARLGYNGRIAENLARANNLSYAHQLYEGSPSHRAAEIDPVWQQCGVGIAYKYPEYYVTVLFAPRNITQRPLSLSELQTYHSALVAAIIQQSASLSWEEAKLSALIQQWMQTNRQSNLMGYVANRGGFKVPMTASNYLVEYDRDFVARVRDKKYFQMTNTKFRKIGLGLLQHKQSIEIYAIYI